MGCSPSSPARNNHQKENSSQEGGSRGDVKVQSEEEDHYCNQNQNSSSGVGGYKNRDKNPSTPKSLSIPLRFCTTTESSSPSPPFPPIPISLAGGGIPVSSNSTSSPSKSKFKKKMIESRHSEKVEFSVPVREGGNLIKLGPMNIHRSYPVRVGLTFPKEDSLFGGLLSGIERLGWSTPTRVNPEEWSNLTQDTTNIDLLIIDYRQPKLLPPNVLNVIRSVKDENSMLVVVAFVKKNSFDKCEAAVSNLHEFGVDWIELDTGISSGGYWQHQLSQYDRSLVGRGLQVASAKALLAALDQCKDMIQITDSSHRIQFVNRAYEKLMGYSCEEISGLDFHELQTKGGSGGGLPEDGAIQGYNINLQQQTSSRHDVSPTSGHSNQLSLASHPNTTGVVATTSASSPYPISAPPFHDHLLSDITQGKEWEGNYMYNPKTGDPIFLNSKIVPFNANPTSLAASSTSYASSQPGDLLQSCATNNKQNKAGVLSTHFIYMSDVPSSYGEKSVSSDVTSNQDVGYPMARGSLKSLRKASYDIKSISNDSSILRRQSLAKLHSLTIEAPITKVINIIAAAQQNCPLYIAQALEKVLEILRTTELYSPQFFEGGSKIKSDDPLTTDLLGALLSQGPRLAQGTGRRSSNENTGSRLAPRPSLPDIAEAPTSLQKLLETEERWSFDVILLEEISDKRPLVWLGMTIFNRFGVAQVLQTDEDTLRNWLTLIEANYHSTNSYHNSTHAADVLQATAYFLSTERLKNFLEPLDEVIALLAAIVHDVDHPGKTSPFLINSANDLALLYNDLSVLESHHAAFTFKLTLSDPRVNIFQNLDSETFKIVRQSLIDMVLATEMNKHFEHLSKFVNVFTKPFLRDDSGGGGGNSEAMTPTEPDISTLITSENVVLVKRMLIKCADVGNPTRPLKLCIEWAKRIAEEYFRQTEEEIARGLPPVMPMFDRNTCSIPKSQTGFIDYFVADMYEAWDAFLDVPEVIDHMKYNYEYWKELDKLAVRSALFDEKYVQEYPPPIGKITSSSSSRSSGHEPSSSSGREQSQL